MGLYPAPFLRRLDTSVQHIIARVSPQYAPTAAVTPPAGAGQAPITEPVPPPLPTPPTGVETR